MCPNSGYHLTTFDFDISINSCDKKYNFTSAFFFYRSTLIGREPESMLAKMFHDAGKKFHSLTFKPAFIVCQDV